MDSTIVMDSTIMNIVNCVFTWLIVILSIFGYVVTVKRTGKHWSFWVVLATGWALLAIPYTLLLFGVDIATPVMTSIWLSSYLLIMVSLLMLFLKLMDLMKNKGKTTENKPASREANANNR